MDSFCLRWLNACDKLVVMATQHCQCTHVKMVPGILAHACNPSTHEAEAEGLSQV